MTAATTPNSPPNRWQQISQPLTIPALAIFSALVFGSIVIVLTDLPVLEAFKNFASAPGAAFTAAWAAVVTAYSSLFEGSLGSPSAIIAALQSGDSAAIAKAFYPVTDSLVAATPYIFAGLAVAVAFPF